MHTMTLNKKKHNYKICKINDKRTFMAVKHRIITHQHEGQSNGLGLMFLITLSVVYVYTYKLFKSLSPQIKYISKYRQLSILEKVVRVACFYSSKPFILTEIIFQTIRRCLRCRDIFFVNNNYYTAQRLRQARDFFVLPFLFIETLASSY